MTYELSFQIQHDAGRECATCQKRDEVPEGTLSCPDRNLAVFHHYRHYEGLRLLPSVCDSKLIQQTLNTFGVPIF